MKIQFIVLPLVIFFSLAITAQDSIFIVSKPFTNVDLLQRLHRYQNSKSLLLLNKKETLIQVPKQRLDSIVYQVPNYQNTQQVINSKKNQYTYDVNGYVSSITNYSWANNKWQPISKQEWETNSQGYRTMESYYSWRENIKRWDGWEKWEYTYNNQSNIEKYVSFKWDSVNGNWLAYTKQEIWFNDNQDVTQAILFKNNTINVLWFVYERDLLYYDDEYNLTLYLNEKSDYNTGYWVDNYRVELTYDLYGNVTSENGHIWRSYLSSWEHSVQLDMAYDENGNRTMFKQMNYASTSNNWSGTMYYEQSFNSNSQELEHIKYTWSWNGSPHWQPFSKRISKYDSNGNKTLFSSYGWFQDLNQWKGSVKYEYGFDENNNNIYTGYFLVYTNANDWSIIFKDETSYTTFDKPLIWTRISWNSNLKLLVNEFKTVYQYDLNDRIENSTYLYWATNNEWINGYKYAYSYDEKNNETIWLTSTFVKSQNKWVNQEQHVKKYNNDYELEDLLIPSSFAFDNMIETNTRKYWSPAQNKWEYNTLNTYYYSGQFISVVKPEFTEIPAYPNPCIDFVKFNSTNNMDNISLQIFDIQGKLIISKSINSNQQVDLSQLNSGVYIYSISFEDQLQKGRIVKQ